MDAYVQVALIEKAKKVFALDGGLFLSFPVVTPVGFQPAALAALLAPQSAADYAAAADFSRVVNFVPRDQVATIDGENFLWRIYGDILANAEVATGRNDPVADGRHAAAQALLYEIDGDGTRHESAAYLSYRSYRDAWFTAQEDYNAQRITGEAATDPAEQQHWHDTLEPQLRGVVGQALADWQTGHATMPNEAVESITKNPSEAEAFRRVQRGAAEARRFTHEQYPNHEKLTTKLSAREFTHQVSDFPSHVSNRIKR